MRDAARMIPCPLTASANDSASAPKREKEKR